jgi:hypothetical protein
MGFVLVVPMADFYMVEDFYMKIFWSRVICLPFGVVVSILYKV